MGGSSMGGILGGGGMGGGGSMGGIMQALGSLFGGGQQGPQGPQGPQDGGGGLESLLNNPQMMLALNILKSAQGQPGQGTPGLGSVLAQGGLDTAGMMQQLAQSKMRNRLLEANMTLQQKHADLLQRQEDRAVKREGGEMELSKKRMELLGQQASLQEKQFKLKEQQESSAAKVREAQADYTRSRTGEIGKLPVITPAQQKQFDLEERKLNLLEKRELAEKEDRETRLKELDQDLADIEGLDPMSKALIKLQAKYGMKFGQGGKGAEQTGMNDPSLVVSDTLDTVENTLKEASGFFGGSDLNTQDKLRLINELKAIEPYLAKGSAEDRQRYAKISEQLLGSFKPEERRRAVLQQIPSAPMTGKVNPLSGQ